MLVPHIWHGPGSTFRLPGHCYRGVPKGLLVAFFSGHLDSLRRFTTWVIVASMVTIAGQARATERGDFGLWGLSLCRELDIT